MIGGIAGAEPLIKLHRPAAVFRNIHIRIIYFVFTVHRFGFLVKNDVGKLLVAVGSGFQRFLDKLAVDMGGVFLFVVPAVNPIYLRAAAVLHLNTVFDSGGRVAVGTGFGFFHRFVFRQSEGQADLDEFVALNQNV